MKNICLHVRSNCCQKGKCHLLYCNTVYRWLYRKKVTLNIRLVDCVVICISKQWNTAFYFKTQGRFFPILIEIVNGSHNFLCSVCPFFLLLVIALSGLIWLTVSDILFLCVLVWHAFPVFHSISYGRYFLLHDSWKP